jgi:hypothetical protein
METSETTTLFKNLLKHAIIFLVMTTTIAILSATYLITDALISGHPINSLIIASYIATYHATSIAISIFLLVLATIGKANAEKNKILAFVFGIITIGLAGVLIIERGLRLVTNIQNIIIDIGGMLGMAAYSALVGIRAGQIALTIILIVYGVYSILTSVKIIKANVPKEQPTLVTAQTSPVSSVQPPAQQGAQGAGSRFCNACGAPLPLDAKFCKSCGKAVG